MDTNESIGRRAEQLLGATSSVVVATPLGSAIFLFALVAVGTAYDIMSPDGLGAPVGIVQTVAQYFLIVAMLKNRNLLPEVRKKGFWSYFALGIISGIATLIGLILLIVPGIIVLVRWLPAYGLLLCQNKEVLESLSESSKQTAAHFWPILLAALLPCLGYVAGVAVYLIPEFEMEVPTFVIAVLSNLLIYGASLLFTALGVATYEALWNQESEYRRVFA